MAVHKPSERGPEHNSAVERAEAYVRAHLDGSVRVSQLCLLTGLSERELRRAFWRRRGIGPKRYIQTERLRAVRQALMEASAPDVTVTRIATDYGFHELGRFARDYRRAYGETPSGTLRGGSPGRLSQEGEAHVQPIRV